MFTLLITCMTLSMRPRIAVDGVPDMDLPPNKDIKVPKFIQTFDDDTFFKTLKAADVVVVFMREQHCPDCDFYAEHYYKAAEKVAGTEGVVVGQIDIHEEGDIFMDYHGVEEDIPAVLVFKTEDVVKWKKRPVQFVVNTRLAEDLPPFVMRMKGPAYRDLTSESDLESLFSDARAHADNLCFVINHPSPESPSKFVTTFANRVAEIERYNTFIGLSRYSGGHSDTLVLQSFDLNVDPPAVAGFDIQVKGDFRNAVKAALQWVHQEKTKRTGHRYDNILTYFQEDVDVPQNHSVAEKITEDKKRYVRANVTGRSSHTKTVILSREVEFVTQENQTMAGIERGVVGMSVGMTRVLVIPPEWRAGWSHGPIELHESSQLLLELKVLHIGDTNELPGRIEWETDPEKIEEHRKKVAEDDRRRKEAIERGEDPDAQCKEE